MEVLIQDQRWQFEQTLSEVEELFDRINRLLDEHKLHVSHMVIDGQEIYDDFQGYIENKLAEISSIDVKLITLEQFTGELMATSYEYCQQAVNKLPELSAQFYQTPAKHTWEQFHAFLEGIGWLIRLMDIVAGTDEVEERRGSFAEISDSLNGQMSELLQSMESNNHTAIADLLQYEVLPLFERLQQALSQSVNGEGV